jgi:hypothetical protein
MTHSTNLICGVTVREYSWKSGANTVKCCSTKRELHARESAKCGGAHGGSYDECKPSRPRGERTQLQGTGGQMGLWLQPC